jgi:twitching motility protein PilT
MNLEPLIAAAKQQGASDLHLESGLPAALRIRGALRTFGEPVPSQTLLGFAREILGEEQWSQFVERRSADLSKTISGVRCRINVLHTARGVGFAIRLLAAFQATLETLNLHPDFKKFIAHPHGLILVSGPTGSGKSSTLAALIQEINLSDTRHIVTIESPIEYTFRPRRAYIRQREVGRDTPSFEQALLDALREDPDVLMVGEMREPETMRLTLNASETGHLVLATVHSSTCAEALQRIAAAFSPEIQAGVCAQLADCLVAVISQRLVFREDLKMRVPECEVLVATHAVKNFIRTREFFKIASALETGADSGMWSLQRYRGWLQSRKKWHLPSEPAEAPDSETTGEALQFNSTPPAARSTKAAESAHKPVSKSGGRIEIEPEEGDWGKILKKP